MMDLLSGFAALSLLSGALLALLDEGSLRRAAAMVAGLLMLLYWSSGLQAFFSSLALPDGTAPSTALAVTGIALQDAESALAEEDAP
ncbi:MAG: hypothetical protein IJE07_14685 [Clostridia bacterium]|nr:hypothetical protein [Clostridia bacterium]